MSEVMSGVTDLSLAAKDSGFQSSELASMLIEAAGEGVWYCDLEKDQVVWNERQYDILGLPGKTLTTPFNNILEMIHDEDKEHLLSILECARQNGERFDVGFRMQQPLTKAYRFCLLRGRYLYDPTGQAIQMVALLKDDTERWEVQQKLDENYRQEKFRRSFVELVSHTLDLKKILEVSSIRLCEFFNADACLVVRYDEEPNHKVRVKLIQGYTQNSMILPERDSDIPFGYLPKMECLKPEEHQSLNPEIMTESSVELALSPRLEKFINHSMLIPNGLLMRYRAFMKTCTKCFTEITAKYEEFLDKYKIKSELAREILYQEKIYGRVVLYQSHEERIWTKEEAALLESIIPQIGAAFYQAELFNQQEIARQEAALANKVKSQFLSNISHEIRTPLNAVLGYSQMLTQLEEGMNSSARALKYLRHIEESGNQLLTLVDNVLDASVLASDSMRISVQWVDIEPLLKNIQDIMEPLRTIKNVQLKFSVEPNLCEMRGDPMRVKQIFLHLINNAIKFNRDGGSVNVVLEKQQPGWVTISVQDTGIGISEAQMSHIFETFHQVDSSFSRQYDGMGLGLALTKHLVELHQGNISVTSQLGVGSTFTIHLPLKI